MKASPTDLRFVGNIAASRVWQAAFLLVARDETALSSCCIIHEVGFGSTRKPILANIDRASIRPAAFGGSTVAAIAQSFDARHADLV